MAGLEVGREKSSGDVFVAAPTSRYDTALKPLSRERVHMLLFKFEDLDWLIRALQREKKRGRTSPSAGGGRGKKRQAG